MNGPADPFTGKLAPRPTWVRWRIVALLVAFSFLSWFLRKSMPVAYTDRIKDQLAISPEAMGWVFSAFLIVYAVLMTPGGWFIDRFGARTALLVMGIGLAVFGALTGLVGPGLGVLAGVPPALGWPLSTAGLALVLFLVIRSCMGAFATPMYPASAHAIARWLPFPRRGWANGLVQGAACVGIALTPLLFGKLIDWFEWPQAFLILAGVTGLVSLVWAAYATDRPEQHPGANPAERYLIRPGELDRAGTARPPGLGMELLGNRSLVCLTLSYAAVGYFEYLFFFWMDYYFDDQLKLSTDQRRIYSAIPILAMAVGMALGGQVSDGLVRRYGLRWGRALVPIAGLLAGAAFLGLSVLAGQPGWIVAWIALAMGAVGAVEAPTWTTAVELGGRRGGTAAGICNTGGNVGGFLAPIVTPLVADRYGWAWAIGLAGLVCLVGMILWLGIDPRECSDGPVEA
jgi:sugar phosphate permease